MKQKLTLLAAFLFLGVTGFAQVLSVKGNVKEDSSRTNIEGVTVAIVDIKDSSVVKATSTNKQGNYSFDNVPKGSYKILYTSLGHRKIYSPIVMVEGFSIDLGTLLLSTEAKSLMEVLVVSKKAFIERKIDKTVINVDASILNAGGTAMEILEASPGVSVDKEGNISLKGKSGVNIMIDGKPAYLSGQQLTDLLKRMPASGLDQVEIMTNPSAKYDAAGNAGIINIKTRKNKLKGFNANISTSYAQNVSSNTSNSINMNYRNGMFNLFGNYSLSNRTEYRDLLILRKFRNTTSHEIENIFDQESFLKKKSVNQNAKLGADFYVGSNTTLGIVVTGNFADHKSTDNNTSLLQNASGHTDSSLNAISMINGNFKNTGVNVNFRHRFDSTGKELTADIDFIDFGQADVQLFDNSYFNADMSLRKPANKLRGSLPAEVSVYSAKIDYSHPFKKDAKFEAGIKSSYVATDNNAMYHNLKGSSWEPDYGKTNHFRYNEHISAAYINYNMQVKKWGFQSGLRVEHTVATGHQSGNQANRDSSFRRSYIGFFPTVFLSYQADANNTFSANIGRRIGRPDYQALNPFYYFLDDYTYRFGNTQLKAQFTNSIEFSYGYKGFFTTTLNYSKTTDIFSEVFKQDTRERKFTITHENIASREEIGISLSATIPVGKTWSSNVYTNVANSKFNGTINGSLLNVSATVFTGNISNQVKLTNSWTAEFNGWYRSKGLDGQIVSDPMWAIGAGVQKEIMNKKGALKLGIRDIFNSQKFSGLVRYDDIDATIVNNNFQRTATLTFTYRFGKPLKTQQERNNGGAGDEQNRIKKG
jgi:iron complex outermembrane recepter protein